MIAVVATLLVWVYLAQPTIDDPSLSTFEKWVSIAYPVGDLLLLVGAARFVMGSNWRVRSLELLVLGLALTLVGDVLFELSVAGRAGALSTFYFISFLLVSIGLGLLLTTAALALEEFNYHRYHRRRDVARLLAYAVFENLGYPPTAPRLAGDRLPRHRARQDRLGAQPRRGFGTSTDPLA
jgi:hypothetical protein